MRWVAEFDQILHPFQNDYNSPWFLSKLNMSTNTEIVSMCIVVTALESVVNLQQS